MLTHHEIWQHLETLGFSRDEGEADMTEDRIQARFRELSKKFHPDVARTEDAVRYPKISNAYEALKRHFTELKEAQLTREAAAELRTSASTASEVVPAAHRRTPEEDELLRKQSDMFSDAAWAARERQRRGN
jgi:DnaJ-class molecular chaperone